jgi:hypothetical protein
MHSNTQMLYSGLPADAKQKLLEIFATKDYKGLANDIKVCFLPNTRLIHHLMTNCLV